jgi:hypothetical protein
MELFAALDVSLKTTSICLVDEDGNILAESTVASDPAAIAEFLSPHRRALPVSDWKRVRYPRGWSTAWPATA